MGELTHQDAARIGQMSPQLAAVVAGLERSQVRLHALLEMLPADRITVRSDPARWSVAECLEHLNLTGRAFIPLLRNALVEARRIDDPHVRHHRRDAVGWMLSWAAGPLPRLGTHGRMLGATRTPGAFEPAREVASMAGTDVLAEFDRLQAEQASIIVQGNGLPLDRVRIISPFDARVRYNAYSAFVVIERHQRRHVRQAEDVWR